MHTGLTKACEAWPDLAVVLEDVGGSRQVQDSVQNQLTVAGELPAPLLKKSHLHLFLTFICNQNERRGGIFIFKCLVFKNTY